MNFIKFCQNLFKNNHQTGVEMDRDPSISVIMPVYNTKKEYLKKAIDSVLNQSFKDFEFIIINSSTDDTEELILEYEDKRIKYIVQGKGGQSKARNIGLKTSKGKYIYYIDADDWISPNALEKMLAKSEKQNLDILISNAIMHNYKTKKILDCMIDLRQILDENVLYNINNPTFVKNFFFISPTPWGKLYKKDFLIKNDLFFIENLIFEDIEIFFRYMIMADNVSVIYDKLYFYRQSVEESSTNLGDARQLDVVRCFSIIENTLKESGLFDTLKPPFYDLKLKLFMSRYEIVTPDLKEAFKPLLREDFKTIKINKREAKKIDCYNDYLKFCKEIGYELQSVI